MSISQGYFNRRKQLYKCSDWIIQLIENHIVYILNDWKSNLVSNVYNNILNYILNNIKKYKISIIILINYYFRSIF